MAHGDLTVVHDEPRGRIVVTDSLTFCDARLGGRDVLVAGSFAGRVAFAFALSFGVRALIAHEAGLGKDAAGVSGLAAADSFGIPGAAVRTMSARLGEGASVFEEGIIGHANGAATALGVRPGMAAREAARLLLDTPAARGAPVPDLVDRSRTTAVETTDGRIVLLGSLSFADGSNRRDVLCAGSHGGRVNARSLLAIVRPRGALVFDGGMAKDRSGISGLALLDEAGVPAAAVDVMSARIGDPASLYETGIISAAGAAARARGVALGQAASASARLLLEGAGPGGV